MVECIKLKYIIVFRKAGMSLFFIKIAGSWENKITCKSIEFPCLVMTIPGPQMICIGQRVRATPRGLKCSYFMSLDWL